MTFLANRTPPPPVRPDREAEPAEIAVSIRAISKSFGNVRVLDATDLDIRKGEFFSLLGPSGCGKTTLLRIVGGFEQPSSGELRIAGRDALGDPPYRRRTNMIFQHMALFPHLTVSQNIAFGLEVRKVDAATVSRRVGEALELVRLPGYGERRIEALSGGQKQRVAIARALVNDPDVLLLDEPLSALDLHLRLQMQQELRRLHRETGKTFLFVTHDQGEAITMSDRIAVMSGGKVVQVGPPREIYDCPNSRFVAEFMGQSNFISGRVARIGPDRSGQVDARGTLLPCRIPRGVDAGQEVTFVLRYEKVEVVPGEHAAVQDLHGTVTDADYMGPCTRLSIRVTPTFDLVADAPNGTPASHLLAGDRVGVRWRAEGPVILTG